MEFDVLQLLNVYITRYNTNGSYWPIAHNAAIFSLIVMQAVASIIFGMKNFGTASTLAFVLIIFTALFNLYCRHKFLPLFNNKAVQVVVGQIGLFFPLPLILLNVWFLHITCVGSYWDGSAWWTFWKDWWDSSTVIIIVLSVWRVSWQSSNWSSCSRVQNIQLSRCWSQDVNKQCHSRFGH